MRRLAIIFVAVTLLFMSMTTVALAYGYKPYESGSLYTTMPHYNYSTSSNLCKTCHAAHVADQATSYKLLRDTSADTACEHCHVGSSAHSAKTAYGLVASPTNTSQKHSINVLRDSAPDKTKTLSGNMVCNSCHTVHGANAILFGGSRTDILRRDPAGDTGSVADDDKKGFCLDCHDKNDNNGSTDKDSHPFDNAPDNTRAWVGTGLNCNGCHNETGNSSTGLFPHTGATYAMLGNFGAGGWTTESNVNFSGGSVKHSSTAGDAATFIFTVGNTTDTVYWKSTKAADRGKANVYLDDVLQPEVDLYNATTLYIATAYSTTGLSTTSIHTLRVEPKGTKNASSSGYRVDIDAFAVNAVTTEETSNYVVWNSIASFAVDAECRVCHVSGGNGVGLTF